MKRGLLYVLVTWCCLVVSAQEQQGITFSGSIQSDMLFPQTDEEIGAEKESDFLSNTYADLMLQSKHVDAGLRFEYMEHPLPGYDNDFTGWGVPNFWIKGRLGKKVELTAGTFYEQFGSGFVLRTYEDRFLGIDNSLLGARIVLKPVQGVTLKALSGKQRRYWSWNKALISGADAEVNLDEFFSSLRNHNTHLMIGASWVNKYDNSDDKAYLSPSYRVNFPKYVNAWDVRASLNHGPWSLLAEYAQKDPDPSFVNDYIFRKGSAAMLSGSYSQKGLSVLLQVKRSENMSFKSSNDVSKVVGTSSTINYLPPFTQDQTYELAALYPYATQVASGEWAYQAELGYNIKRKTPLGGKYGMLVKVNFSHIRGIDREFYDSSSDPFAATDGYSSSFFKWGDETYFQNLDITVTRKLSKDFKLSLMYMNQHYNMTVVEGSGGMVRSNIYIADAKYQFSPKTTLRGEFQYLATKDDLKDWIYGLLELSLAPHWMITVSDMYNIGYTHVHYYQGLVTCNFGQHRIQAGYVRTHMGYNCAGGVCRWIPATKGFTISYNFNF